MTEILPGILAHSLKELKQELNKVKWAKKVQVDIMDGKFVKNKTIQAPTLAKAKTKTQMQIHYMGKKPQQQYKKYARLGAKEFIFHAEATKKAPEILEDIRLSGMKAGIAFSPKTKISKHKDTLIHADIALILTVHPGYSGQKFLKEPTLKINQIRKINPIIKIGIDGGIHENTIKHACKADFVIATSAVTETDNPRKAYNALKKRCKK